MDSPFGQNTPPGSPAAPESDPLAVGTSRQFRFPLPFDPIRLLAGILSRWPWIVVGMILFGTVGTFIGIQITKPSYAISVSLIKRRVPQTVQTSETGQAFRPVDLNDATLLATLLASEPLDLAFKRAENGIDPGRGRTLTEASQLEGTDIFFITYHSPVSPEDALNFTAVWAEEINAYTQRLQQTEAREVRQILQKEVDGLENRIDALTRELLEFSKDRNFLGGDSQVAAVLGKLSQIELELETARISAASKQEQVASLTKQIRHQSPIEQQLKTAREELANLRATYTDANPLVLNKLQSIDYLVTQIAELDSKGVANLDSYTGTPLGNQIYLTIIGLNNELLELKSRIGSLEKLSAATAKRLDEFPAIISGFEALQKKRDAHIEGLSLMSNRLKEAEIFASGAPGYWQVFQAPDPRSIVPSSLVKKPIILGAAGAMAGAGLAALLTLLLTHRTSRRSILECCVATRAPLICHLPTTFEEDARAAIDQFWITHLAPQLERSERVLFWTAALDPADERRFWSLLADSVRKDTGANLKIHDLTPDPLWADVSTPDCLIWSSAAPAGCVLMRASSLPHGEARTLLSRTDCWIAAVAGQKDSLTRARRFRSVTEAYLPPCHGTLAWTERPAGPIREVADHLSCFITRRFS